MSTRLHLSDAALFLYLCALFAHRTGAGFDYYFLRGSFVLYVFVFFVSEVCVDVSRGRRRKLFTGMVAWFVVFWAFAYISALWSESISNTLNTTYMTNMLQAFFLVLFLGYRIQSADDLIFILQLFILAGLYGAIVLYVKTPSSSWGSERVGSAVGLGSNQVGLNNAFLFLICFFVLRYTRSPLYMVLMVPFVLVAFMSGSRKAFLIVVAGIVLILSFSYKGIKGFIVAAVAIGVAAILCYVVMTVPQFYDVLGYRLEKFVTDSSSDGSASERAWYREYAASMWKNSPIIGYGFNGFVTEMQQINYSHQAYSHCNHWELLADLGIVGFFLYYGLHAKMLYGFARVFREHREDAVFAIAFLLIIFVSDYFYVSFVSPEVYVYLTFIYCLYRLRMKTPAKRKSLHGVHRQQAR